MEGETPSAATIAGNETRGDAKGINWRESFILAQRIAHRAAKRNRRVKMPRTYGKSVLAGRIPDSIVPHEGRNGKTIGNRYGAALRAKYLS
jgi:hypothetical protein